MEQAWPDPTAAAAVLRMLRQMVASDPATAPGADAVAAEPAPRWEGEPLRGRTGAFARIRRGVRATLGGSAIEWGFTALLGGDSVTAYDTWYRTCLARPHSLQMITDEARARDEAARAGTFLDALTRRGLVLGRPDPITRGALLCLAQLRTVVVAGLTGAERDAAIADLMLPLTNLARLGDVQPLIVATVALQPEAALGVAGFLGDLGHADGWLFMARCMEAAGADASPYRARALACGRDGALLTALMDRDPMLLINAVAAGDVRAVIPMLRRFHDAGSGVTAGTRASADDALRHLATLEQPPASGTRPMLLPPSLLEALATGAGSIAPDFTTPSEPGMLLMVADQWVPPDAESLERWHRGIASDLRTRAPNPNAAEAAALTHEAFALLVRRTGSLEPLHTGYLRFADLVRPAQLLPGEWVPRARAHCAAVDAALAPSPASITARTPAQQAIALDG